MCIIGGTEGKKLGAVTTKSISRNNAALFYIKYQDEDQKIDKRERSKHSYVLNMYQHHSQHFVFTKLFNRKYSMPSTSILIITPFYRWGSRGTVGRTTCLSSERESGQPSSKPRSSDPRVPPLHHSPEASVISKLRLVLSLR